MGDDTAVVEAQVNLLTNDSIVHGCHFDDGADARAGGAKLLKRNLSDIAAMGGTPHDAVLALFLPPRPPSSGSGASSPACAIAHWRTEPASWAAT
jgi:thiamine-monophosphate kinase